MIESKTPGEWIKNWRQYAAAWTDLIKKPAFGAAASPFSIPTGAMPGFSSGFSSIPGISDAANSWQEGIEQWSHLFGNAGKQSDVAERFIEGAKSYLAMLQGLSGAQDGGASAASTNPFRLWLEGFVNAFAAPGEGASAGFAMPGFDEAMAGNPFLKAVRDITGQGARGFGELPSSFAPFVDQWRKESLSWLRVPAFGLAREHQEHYQRGALAFIEYQEALRAYNLLLLKAGQRGFELLEDKLAEHSEPGRAIDSPRALYDLWVDAAEEAYAGVAVTDEFAKVYGDLANAQMRVRAQIQAEIERISTDLGMPTRSELNSVHQRLHDLRREFREDKEARFGEDTNFKGGDVETRIAELRAEITALKSAAAPARRAPVHSSAKGAAVDSSKLTAKSAEKPPRAIKRKVPAKRGRVARLAKSPSPPAPVVQPAPIIRPRPVGKGERDGTSFGDAIAAMRQRVVRSGNGKSARLKAAAAYFAAPSKRAATTISQSSFKQELAKHKSIRKFGKSRR